MISFAYSALRKVLLEADAVDALPRLVEELGAKRVMILASRTLNRETGAVRAIQAALGHRHGATCDGVGAHSPRPDVMRALAVARDVDTDLLVSVGGGSVIDACKALQFCLDGNIHTPEQLLVHGRFSDGRRGEKADSWVPDPSRQPLSHIAVPTTLSAAEFSDNAGLSDPERGLKEGYRAEGLCPRVVLYDPALSRHTPLWLWLSTAVRSIDHAIEGYCSAESHAYMHAHYLHALRLFRQALPAIHADPDSLPPRSLAQQACWLAGCALGRVSHGASHGIGYILGASCGVPHGHTSCVMLPAVLQWNESHNAGQQQAVAEALGGGASAPRLLHDLFRVLGLPTRLRDVGVPASRLDAIALAASRHPVVRRNPRPVRDAADVREILELAW